MEQVKPWWVGVRASEILGIEHLFAGGISIVGVFSEDGFKGFSVEQETHQRLNHNNYANDQKIEEILVRLVRRAKELDPGARFLFQDQLCFSQLPDFWQVCTCNNTYDLLAPLKDKGIARSLFGRHVPTVGSTMMFVSELSYDELTAKFPNSRKFVVQAPGSAGGHGSLLVDSQSTLVSLAGLGTRHVVVSEYRERMVSMNSHLVIFPDRTLVLSPSAQLVCPDESGRLLYAGCDFFLPGQLPQHTLDQIASLCMTVGELLRASGYRGVVGLDYLVNEQEVLFVEINPRFQASTAILNTALLDQGLPSVHELHMRAFSGLPAPILPKDVQPSLALIHLTKSDGLGELSAGLHGYSSPDSRDTRFAKDGLNIRLELEAGIPETTVENGASLGRMIVDKPLIFNHPTMGTLINHSLTQFGQRPRPLLKEAVSGKPEALARLKFNLFSHGVQITPSALELLSQERQDLTIRDGIAGGLEIALPHRVHVNVPIKEHFALVSSYAIDAETDRSGYQLTDLNGDALAIDILPIPDFVGRLTSRGTPMVNVGQMFNERLSIEIFYGCINNRTDGTACQFCELGAEDTQEFTEISDIRELVAYCEASPTIPMRHVLIGGGTPPEPRWSLYYDALEAVRSETASPVYMMIAPPNDLRRLDELHARGLAEVGMNIELYDRNLARRFMPAKGKLSLSRYWAALERAVSLWGATGAVRSILIVGLEPLASTLAGVEELCRRGVMPILSPYRPVPGTPLEHCPPPSPEMMFEAWQQGHEIAGRFGLQLGPTCVACQNNTIAMPFGNGYRYY